MNEQVINCRQCPSCWYTVKKINDESRHFLHCMHNQAVEDAMGFPHVLMDRPRADGPLPRVVEPQGWCPRRE